MVSIQKNGLIRGDSEQPIPAYFLVAVMQYPYAFYPNRNKLYLLIALCLGFVVAGFFLLFTGGETSSVTFWAGLVGVVFFGLCTEPFFQQLRRKTPTLTINSNGLEVQTMLRKRTIPWEDIEGFREAAVLDQHFVLVDVCNPQEYLDKAGGKIFEKGMQSNLDRYGTPLALPTNTLKVDHNELLSLLRNELKDYRSLPEALRVELKIPNIGRFR